MAKAAAGEAAGMDRAELRKHLRFAREEPIQVAFALGGDGKAVLQMHRRKMGRALEKQLKDDAPDSKSHRWGTVSADPDDPKLAVFQVNKAGGGLARMLVVALKGTGFSKVRIVLEDGSAVEDHEEQDETEQEGDGQAAAAPDGGDASPAAATADGGDDDWEEPPSLPPATTAGPDGEDAGPSSSGQPDAKALAGKLTGLVRQMLDAIRQDPSQKSALAELATDAQASLKRGDLDQAAAGIEVLRQALDTAAGGTEGDGSGVDQDAGPGASASSDSGDDPAAADMAGNPDAPSAGADQASTTDGGGPQWEAGPSFDPKDDTSGGSTPAPAQDAGALTAALTGLVKQIMPLIAADPAQRDAFKGILAQAQASLKSGDLDAAGGHVGALQAMLDGAAGAQAEGQAGAGGDRDGAMDGSGTAIPDTSAPPAGPDPAMVQKLQKLRTIWDATVAKVGMEVDKLAKTVAAASADHELGAGFEQEFQAVVQPLLSTFEGNLSDVLTRAAQARDADEHERMLGQARDAVGRFMALVQSHPVIEHLDGNPFAPVAVGKTLTATLSAVSNTLR